MSSKQTNKLACFRTLAVKSAAKFKETGQMKVYNSAGG